jgi:hypothetical protein
VGLSLAEAKQQVIRESGIWEEESALLASQHDALLKRAQVCVRAFLNMWMCVIHVYTHSVCASMCLLEIKYTWIERAVLPRTFLICMSVEVASVQYIYIYIIYIYICIDIYIYIERERERESIHRLSLSLSLSLTHTHTRKVVGSKWIATRKTARLTLTRHPMHHSHLPTLFTRGFPHGRPHININTHTIFETSKPNYERRAETQQDDLEVAERRVCAVSF